MKSHTAYTGRTPRVHRCVAAVLIAAGLGGCAAAPGGPAAPGLLRNPTVTLAGTTRFDPARFAQTWQTVACIGTCAPSVQYIWDGQMTRKTAQGEARYQITGPGILRGADTLVVMWVDDGFRTAAVGEAGGRWAAVIDRTAAPSADRIAAATEILDFNGWDVAKLKGAMQ